ncbi:hypothetical protein GCM10009839_71250 [Catenulispora yoronensis]|uniref:RES domain-containing protein n=1 Tax=Catenulispora yoronensis TaxID=450799 RepID=A0ABN2V6D0_9ACTN
MLPQRADSWEERPSGKTWGQWWAETDDPQARRELLVDAGVRAEVGTSLGRSQAGPLNLLFPKHRLVDAEVPVFSPDDPQWHVFDLVAFRASLRAVVALCRSSLSPR